MSQDSLSHDEDDHQHDQEAATDAIATTATVSSPTMNGSKKFPFNSQVTRMNNLDEHIRLVKQKKEEAEVLRLRRFQEQLRKKEQKWQQQQLERVKKWLQLRNRDIDHRAQVEERRRKREEEIKAKLDDLIRREKEREHKANSNTGCNPRINALHNPDGFMTASTDILTLRRTRLRFNQQDMAHRQDSNNSPLTINSPDHTEQSNPAANTSHQPNIVDGHRYRPLSRQSHDISITNDDSTASGTARSSARSRSRPMPASYTYWLNTGDNNNLKNASFMRLTYAATCRSRLSRSVERCPRACRGHDEVPANNTTTANGEMPRRIQSINRQHLQETISRLSKPKTVPMAQSIQISSARSSSNGIPVSQSSHQIRSYTPPVSSNQYSSPSHRTSSARRPYSARSTTSTRASNSPRDSRASPVNESVSDNLSTIKSASARLNIPGKPPVSKPPVSLSSPRSKPTTQRSVMPTSHSSSSISSSLNVNKTNSRRLPVPPSTVTSTASTTTSTTTTTIAAAAVAASSQIKSIPTESALSNPTDKSINLEPQAVEKQEPSAVEIEPIPIAVESNADAEISVTDSTNSTNTAAISKREQQILEEQEYQRKLSQKIREAQQRMELERQREEERQRQLEREEYEREQEQIRLVEEQRRAEEERLQRAIRENEIKRQEEQRLQQQREEQEKRQAEEAERLQRERQEKAKKEEEERIERKKRLDLIMRRTRPVSPSSKNENLVHKDTFTESNGHDRSQSSMSHSVSDHQFPSNSSSTENILTQSDATIHSDGPKFKSPLIQNLLNKARSTRSTDNLTQSTNGNSDEEQTESDLQAINTNGSTELQTTLISPS